MFPFDSNLLIGILIAATIPLYIIILRKLNPDFPKTFRKDKPPETRPKKKNQKTEKKDKPPEKKPPTTVKPKESGSECSHYFGYLRTLPKNASLPDECLGCSKIIECLTYREDL
jgi:hypothetical protein